MLATRPLAIVVGPFALLALAHAQAMCGVTSVGLTPIDDLGTGTYAGFQGGLYPGGTNAMPPAHGAHVMTAATSVVPLDAAGAPDPVGGRIVFLSIGMSNTHNEWDEFMPLAAVDPLRDPRVQLVNGAIPGWSADTVNTSTSAYWPLVDAEIAAAGATNAQVQVAWIKEAHQLPSAPFPTEALHLRDDLIAIAQILHDRFPNLKLAYLSSRIYAGYASVPVNPEPYAYQGGFAVKWAIEEQITGSPALNFDPLLGTVEAPVLAWGPYLWADGLIPRSDGLTWECADFLLADGTHPSLSGALKVANRLLAMCHTDPSAMEWYLLGGFPAVPVSFCTGDALDPLLFVPCPCGNVGSVGHGCRSSADPDGALLVRSGQTQPDTIVLTTTDMPLTATSIYLKGSLAAPNGIVFGDGLRCIDGALLRLGIRAGVAGASQYPGSGDAPVSVRGQTPPGSGVSGFYQTYYRNAANYCTSATFNVSNAVRIDW